MNIEKKYRKKMTKNLYLRRSLLALLVYFASGCAKRQVAEEFPTSTNVSEELTILEKDLNSSTTREENIYAPENYNKAKNAIALARLGEKNLQDNKEVLNEAMLARDALVKAHDFADISKTKLASVAKARDSAQKNGATNLFPGEMISTDNELSTLASRIEKNDQLDVSASVASLEKAFLDLELKAIDKKYLGESRDVVAQAIQEGARKNSNLSLVIAEQKIADLEGFIIADRQNFLEIEGKAKITLTLSQTLLQEVRDHNTSIATPVQSELKIIDQQMLWAREKFKTNEATIYKQGNSIVISLRNIDFPSNSSTLSKQNLKVLLKVANVVDEFPLVAVVVEGHSDSDGSKVLNDRLSENRAKSVTAFLISNSKIAPGLFTSTGLGYARPLFPNNTKKGKEQNRRIDVIVTTHNSIL